MIINCGRDSGVALAKTWFELGDYEKYEEIMALITLPESDDSIEGMSVLLLVNEVKQGHKDKIAKLLSLNEQGIKLYRSGLYPASTSIFLDAYEIMPNNTQLSLNLAQSITKGWPPNEKFSKKKMIVKQCINVVEAEAEQLDSLSMQRYRSIEAQLKNILSE